MIAPMTSSTSTTLLASSRGPRSVAHTSRRDRLCVTCLAVPNDFGLVAGSVAATGLVSQYLAVQVAVARRKYNVAYPAMYAEGTSDEANQFNCIQRAHQNMLEYLPNALACQLVMGFVFPKTAAVLGLLWALGRLVYAAGYSTGDPMKRTPGSLGAGVIYLALIGGAGYAGYVLFTS